MPYSSGEVKNCLRRREDRDGSKKGEKLTLWIPSQKFSTSRPQIRQGYPLNLSILISGGKETNKDSHSNGE
jgi:hypothetical protein